MAPPAGITSRLLRGPGAGLAWLVHRRATGSRAWLRVTVKAQGPMATARQLEDLRRVAEDPLVAGILLDVRGAPGGWATVWDWRDAIHHLREARRWVEAWVEQPTEATLALAAAADRVTVPEGTTVQLPGVGTVTTHQAAALARLGLEVEVVAAGAFKSAGEPFSRRFASPSAREALTGLLADLSEQVGQALATDRGVDPTEVAAWRDQGWMAPHEAVAAGLVDAVGTPSSVRASMAAHVGHHARELPLEGWASRSRVLDALDHAGADEVIAVVHLTGPIQSEEGGSGPRIRSRATRAALRELAEDDAVCAVVLHIDSPGGGVLPSERIADGIARLARRKPVVACDSDVAASGGVLIATPATRVIARPTTITGSIGVIGGKLVATGALRKVGVAMEPVGGGRSLAAFSPIRRFTDDERVRFETELSRVYGRFVDAVARGRGRSADALEPHCRGRVWTGRQGLAHGFVDGLGGLAEAVSLAGRLAELEEGVVPRIRHLDPNHRGALEALRALAPGSEAARVEGPQDWIDGALSQALGPIGPSLWAHPGRPLAMWPFPTSPWSLTGPR